VPYLRAGARRGRRGRQRTLMERAPDRRQPERRARAGASGVAPSDALRKRRLHRRARARGHIRRVDRPARRALPPGADSARKVCAQVGCCHQPGHRPTLEHVSTWEDRMAARAKARQAARSSPGDELAPYEPEPVPCELRGELPAGEPDTARSWCTSCGLPDPPGWGKFDDPVPCPRCGSAWRWFGRLADRDGTAAGPPDPGECPECYQWERYSSVQEHFGWAWWRTCDHGCGCEHHKGEVWLALRVQQG